MATCRRGFTVIEVMVALVVLSVGLLGLLGSAALLTRLVGGGERGSAAAMLARERLERLRTTGCVSRTGGVEVRYRGATPVDSLAWRFVDAGNAHWRVVLRAGYVPQPGRSKSDSLESEISCLF